MRANTMFLALLCATIPDFLPPKSSRGGEITIVMYSLPKSGVVKRGNDVSIKVNVFALDNGIESEGLGTLGSIELCPKDQNDQVVVTVSLNVFDAKCQKRCCRLR